MLSRALLFIFAVLFPAAKTSPFYSDTVITTQEDLLQKLVNDAENGQDDEQNVRSDEKTIYPLLLHHESRINTFPKGAKETFQHGKKNSMVDELKTMVFKLAAADNMRSQGFPLSEQNLPKPNKRACFWKYCVTN